MNTYRIIIDTNVLIASLRSRQGASYALMQQIHRPEIQIVMSVPLALEYEQVAKAQQAQLVFAWHDIEAYIDYLCSIAIRQKIYYLWRPCLRDAGDEMILEAAVASRCDYIVTFNKKDFAGSERFGILSVAPKELLTILAKGENHE
jgi:putative PIN family toxin of toxin-antitoxin system